MSGYLDETGQHEVVGTDTKPTPPLPGAGNGGGSGQPPAGGRGPAPARRFPFTSTRATGVARNVQIRSETFGQGASRQVLTFRLDRYDDGGNRLAPVPVMMRTHSIMGQLNEGEQVMVKGRWRHGQLKVKRIANLTTGAVITAPVGMRSYRWALALFGIAILAAAIVLGAGKIGDTLDQASTITTLPVVNPGVSIPTGEGGDGSSGDGGSSGDPGQPPPSVTAPPPSVTAAPPPSVTQPLAPPGQAILAMKNLEFVPTGVDLAAGGELFAENDETDGTAHKPIIEVPGDIRGISVEVPAGQTVSFGPINLPAGDYTFYCGNHPTQMRGVLHVR